MVFHILKRERAVVPLLFMVICAVAWAQEEFEGLSDPMRPYDAHVRNAEAAEPTTAAAPAAPLLQSIVIGERDRYAIIDGQRVRVGSMVGDAFVEDILPRQVILVRNARREVLTLLSTGADGGALVKKEVGND